MLRIHLAPFLSFSYRKLKKLKTKLIK